MKTKTPTPELNRQILDEASEWFVDFRVGDVDTVARERFDEWLRRSPEHIRAYWEIAKTYVELSGLRLPASSTSPASSPTPTRMRTSSPSIPGRAKSMRSA